MSSLVITACHIPHDISDKQTTFSFDVPDNFRLVVNAGSVKRAGQILQIGGSGYHEGKEAFKEYGATFDDVIHVSPGNSIYRIDLVGVGATPTYNAGNDGDNRGMVSELAPTLVSQTLECMHTFLWPKGDVRSISLVMT